MYISITYQLANYLVIQPYISICCVIGLFYLVYVLSAYRIWRGHMLLFIN